MNEILQPPTLSCGGPCDHTEEEHAAFDSGAASKPGEINPFTFSDSYALWDAWESGRSAATLKQSLTVRTTK